MKHGTLGNPALTMAARFVLGRGWDVSILIGSLVIVTSPTVITPLLGRIQREG